MAISESLASHTSAAKSKIHQKTEKWHLTIKTGNCRTEHFHPRDGGQPIPGAEKTQTRGKPEFAGFYFEFLGMKRRCWSLCDESRAFREGICEKKSWKITQKVLSNFR
jgi:hypothetical protein